MKAHYTYWIRKAQMSWFEAVHPVRLDTFQKVFALTFLAYTGFWFLNAYEWLTPYGFHYTAETQFYSLPTPLPPMPRFIVPVFGIVLFGSTISLVVGWKARVMVWVALGCAIYIQLVDMTSSNFTLNKLYIVIFTVLALAPPAREFPSQSGKPSLLQSAWPIRIIQSTILIQYFTAGMCKILHGDWLTNPNVLWTQIQGIYQTDFAAFLVRLFPQWAWSTLMYSALIFEVTAPLFFLVKRLRPLGIAWALLFQTVIALTMEKLFFFSFQISSLFILFLDVNTLLFLRQWRNKNEP